MSTDPYNTNNPQWQSAIRQKIEDLEATLSVSNAPWNAWELEFIESVAAKLEKDFIKVSPAQYQKIWDLWDKI